MPRISQYMSPVRSTDREPKSVRQNHTYRAVRRNTAKMIYQGNKRFGQHDPAWRSAFRGRIRKNQKRDAYF